MRIQLNEIANDDNLRNYFGNYFDFEQLKLAKNVQNYIKNELN